MKKGMLTLAALVGFAVGLGVGRGCAPAPAAGRRGAERSDLPAETRIWTCSMDPQIKRPGPGRCPICGMDLVLVATPGVDDGGAGAALTLSEAASRLADVETAPVERRWVDVELLLTGKVVLDETRLAAITARVAGRVDRMYANVVGTSVNKGEHLVDLYSPDLVAAQQELIQAVARVASFPADTISASILQSTRSKLRLWGLAPQQIAEIERSGKGQDHLTFYAPMGGVVMAKDVIEGNYVTEGTRIYTVADLSHVWVKLDAYESDLTWICYGQSVDFEIEASPGQSFRGTVAFIDPVLDPMTRTVKVRVDVANTDGRLKPEMFARARLRARVAEGGRVVPPDLRGKWICTMHPEVIENAPGACRVCQMALVAGETSGFVPAQTATQAPLVIPATAALVTGTRAVVYVAVPGSRGRFEGRTVKLGPRAGRHYVVASGLSEGERVVVNGAFKIDSSLQIQGKRSMMNAPVEDDGHAAAAPEGPAAALPLDAGLSRLLRQVVDGVAATGVSLSGGELAGAREAAASAVSAARMIEMDALAPDGRTAWLKFAPALTNALTRIEQAADIGAARAALAEVAAPARALLRAWGPEVRGPVHVMHCPMAFNNRGAFWIQRDAQVRNPYFGAAMLTCGEEVAP